jgi:hypothetical protein
MTAPGQIGPYALAQVRIAGGDETLMFEARLLCDGQPIAVVSNSGTGGCHTYRPLEAGGWAAIRSFEEYATEWGRQQQPAIRFEPNDALVFGLLEQWWGGQPIYR